MTVPRPPAPAAVHDVTAALLRASMVTVAAYVALAVADVPRAEAGAILAGACGIVPRIGPVLAGIVCVTLIGPPVLELGGCALLTLALLLHRQVVAPLMGAGAGLLSPAVAASGVLLGAAFAGLPGAAVAMPAVVVVSALVTGRREAG